MNGTSRNRPRNPKASEALDSNCNLDPLQLGDNYSLIHRYKPENCKQLEFTGTVPNTFHSRGNASMFYPSPGPDIPLYVTIVTIIILL